MASGLSLRTTREWAAGYSAAATRLTAFSIVPVILAVVVFKLAISDGGRDQTSLTLAQTVIFSTLAVLILAGRVRLMAVGRALIGIIGVVAVTAVWSVRPEASVRELLLWTTYLGIAVITASTLTGPAAARRFLDAAVAIAGWLVLIALFMFWGANNPSMRWYSTFYWPNPFAAFLLLVLPLELSRFLHARQRREMLAHGALCLLLALSLVLTYSRGAWLSLVVVAPVAIALLRPPSWVVALRRALLLAGGVSLAVVLLTRGAVPGPASSGVVGRAASVTVTGDLSIQGRLAFWRAGLAMFHDHPLVGTGPGTFGAVHAAYQKDVRFYARDPHNLYVQTAAEMGLVGMAAVAALLLSIALLWRRGLQQAWGREEYPLIVGVGLGLLAFFLHSGVDMDWMFPANPAMAFALVGVLLWYERGERSSGGEGRRTRGVRRMGAVLALVGAVAIAVSFQVAQRRFVEAQRFVWAGRWVLASESYARAVRWNPLSARYRAAEAGALTQLPSPPVDEAEALLRSATVLDRMNATYPLQLARVFMDNPTPDRSADAETLLQQALALDRWNRPETYRALARVYRMQGRPAAAARVYRESTAMYLQQGLGQGSIIYALLWPEVVGLVLDAAEHAMRGGDVRGATRILEALVMEDPRAVPAVLRLSAVYLTVGRRDDARSVLERAARVVPSNRQIQDALRALR